MIMSNPVVLDFDGIHTAGRALRFQVMQPHMRQMENAMRRLLLTSCTAATAFAAAVLFAPHPAQATTIAAPIGLRAAIQQSDVKQDVRWRRGYWGYRPYTYYAYRPYYAYAYRPYYAYAYRPYAYSYVYRPYAYGTYAYGGYGSRTWAGRQGSLRPTLLRRGSWAGLSAASRSSPAQRR
jgi:hypothetical protein